MSTGRVRAHYEQRWGPPSREAEFEATGIPIEVYKWDADANPEGVALYATAGLSDHVIDEAHPAHRLELFTGLSPEVDDVAKPLAMLATYPVRTAKGLAHGETVTFPEALWPGTEMRSFLVARPSEEFLVTLEGQGDEHVEFLQAIPIFASELEYKRRSGVDDLLERWKSERVPFWDPTRSPVPA